MANGLIDEDDLATALIGSSDTTNDVEFVEYFSATAKTYYIRVTGEDLGSPYVLTIRSFDDDLFEENNSFIDAADINTLRGINLISLVQRDDDYFFFSIPKDQVHMFTLSLDLTGNEDITYAVYDAEQSLLPSEYYLSRVVSPDASLYYIKVTGDNSGTSYGLSWDFDNIDEYEDNETDVDAPDLTRARLQPVWDKDTTYRLPIKELRFDYSLFDSRDPFGHAIQESDDWYALRIPAWKEATAKQGNNTITVLKRDYYVQLLVDLAFTHEDGDINLEVYDSTDLVNPIGRSETLNDVESLTVAVDTTDDDAGLVYYIKVYGDNAANSYELTWDVTTDDGYEDNNFVERAFDLTNVDGASTEDTYLHEIEYLVDVNGDNVIDGSDGGFTRPIGYGNQTTDDWYAVVSSGGATDISVECLFYSDDDISYTYVPDDLDIDIELYFLADNDGDPGTADVRKPVLIGRSTSITAEFPDHAVSKREDVQEDWTEGRTESGIFDITGSGDGIYFIRVFYDNRIHPYTLKWADGVADNSGDADIIQDYLNGDWSFVLPSELASALLASPLANTDGDDMPNWAEYALGLNASIPDYAVVGQSIVEIEGEEYFQFEYLRTKEAVARGFQFIVEESGNMVFDGSTAVFVGTEDVDSDIERVFYRCSGPMDEVNQCFFRLSVEEPVAKEE